jgi:GNAT superfamily N-acetyltransferase
MSTHAVAGRASITLADGTSVRLEPMRAEDEGRLLRFHETLSPETTRLRFFTFHRHLSEDELHRFTHVDHRDREAMLAVVDGEIIGVARFDRLPGTADAEVAFVVADAWQGRGVGTVLLGGLVGRAREVGVTRFVADTLSGNWRMLNVFSHSGLPMTQAWDPDLVRVTLRLDAPPDLQA